MNQLALQRGSDGISLHNKDSLICDSLTALRVEQVEEKEVKAIRVREFGAPEVMRLEDTPDLRPSPKQVVLRVKAAGVNPADTYMRSGMYSRKPILPYTPGSDAAGLVESVGEGVTNVAVGARVYTSGTITGAYAEQALCEEYQVHPLPEKLSFAQGAAINVPYATAYRALFQRAKATRGETVLVHGATGGVGIAAVQLAHAAGMKVIGTGGTEKGRNLVSQLGALHVLDHRAPNYLDQVQVLTDGHGVDVILEMLANVNLDRDVKALAMGGRVVVIGSRGRIEIDPRDTMVRDASILGMLLFNITTQEAASIHAALGAGLENGSLRPVVGKEMPLSDAPRAHREIMEPGAYGKIALIP
jgi:NADPH2:quinone reductase